MSEELKRIIFKHKYLKYLGNLEWFPSKNQNLENSIWKYNGFFQKKD